MTGKEEVAEREYIVKGLLQEDHLREVQSTVLGLRLFSTFPIVRMSKLPVTMMMVMMTMDIFQTPLELQ